MYRQRVGNLANVDKGLGGEYGQMAFEWLADGVKTNSKQMINLSFVDAAKELQRNTILIRNMFIENDTNFSGLKDLKL